MADKNLLYDQMNKENTDKIHISFSEFSLFNQCAHKHLIQKYLKLGESEPSIHLYFGNAIHEAIELSVKNGLDIENRVNHFRDSFRKNMMDNMMNDPSFKELESFISQGENILKILDLEKVFEDYEIVSVEEPLYEKVHGNFYFKGFIDLVAKNKKTGKYLIIDWKTSGEQWKLSYKLKDEIFLCQMRFYKFFWGKKNNVAMEDIECKYIVLNRLKNKKDESQGFGELQHVPLDSTKKEIQESLALLADSIKSIHVLNQFRKIKFEGDEYKGCRFCEYKDGVNPLCNQDPNQYKHLLLKHK